MKQTADKRAFWVADAETDPFKYGRVPQPFIWGVYTGAGFHTFLDTDEFISFIREQEVIVYFHNGGKFDLHLILKHCNINEEIKIINGRIASVHIGKAEIRDSYLLFPAPLSEFGAKLSIDYKKMEKKVRHLHMPEIVVYLKADCVELWNALFEHELEYGRHLTQAGASMAQWLKISGDKSPHTDKDYFKKFSEYYYGGRVQCFEKGYIKGPIGVWDIRSAYPWAMLSQHPYEPVYIEIPQPKEVRPTDMVTVSCISVGTLPFRGERGIITYPRDNMRRKYKVPGHEILAAIETASVREVFFHHVYRFVGMKDFAPYIHHFYEGRKIDRSNAKVARKNGDEIAARLHDVKAFFKKRYMTGLYGKFGANPENYGNYFLVKWDDKMRYHAGNDDEGISPGDLYDGKRDYRFNGKLGPYAVLRDDLDPWQEHFINVATAASITSQVRAHLWRAINAADGPVYCDTDCVMARNAPGLPIGEELGNWNKEGTAQEAYIAGKKLYYLKGIFEPGPDGKPKRAKMASKGVRPDPKKIKAAALGKTVKVRSDAPTFTLSGKRGVYFQERNIRMTANTDA